MVFQSVTSIDVKQKYLEYNQIYIDGIFFPSDFVFEIL